MAAVTKCSTPSYLLSRSEVHVHPSISMMAWNSSLETQAAGSQVPRSQMMMEGVLLISASRVKQSSTQIWKRMSRDWNRIRYSVVNLDIRMKPPACTTRVGISGTESTLKPCLPIYYWILVREVLLPPQGPPVMTILQMGWAPDTRGGSSVLPD